jgi:hypothetical protein
MIIRDQAGNPKGCPKCEVLPRIEIQEASRLTPEHFGQFLNGEIPAIILRQKVDLSVCKKISANFRSLSDKRAREDGVAADFVGANHYKMTTEDYLNLAESSRAAVESLFEKTRNPARLIQGEIAHLLKARGFNFRVAKHNGRKAGECRLSAFNEEGEFALRPHDDLGQLSHPAQKGFEIQNCIAPKAVNIYLEVPQEARGLRAWNRRFCSECRAKLGIESSGYPYPMEALEGLESTLIKIRLGDVLLLDGCFPHAVENTFGRDRFLLNFFFGKIDAHTYAYWC